MNGKEILADTNILIYLFNGDNTIAAILQSKFIYISFITELELFGLKNISSSQTKKIQSLVDECIVVPLNNEIKQEYILQRQTTNLKLADSIVAATALYLGIPLITADKNFVKIPKLNLMLFQK